MDARPEPTLVMHFTHLQHLPTIASRGLVSDNLAREEGLLAIEVGNQGIKERRRNRQVPIPPGGSVADYVPFYFAPRSPMMYAIDRGNVPTYQDGCRDLIYLVSTVELLTQECETVLFTDRNAVLQFAEFSDDVDKLDDLVDWQLMKATWWNNTNEHPDRKERRMAECLVLDEVPWHSFIGVATYSEDRAQAARSALAPFDAEPVVHVRPDWYY